MNEQQIERRRLVAQTVVEMIEAMGQICGKNGLNAKQGTAAVKIAAKAFEKAGSIVGTIEALMDEGTE